MHCTAQKQHVARLDMVCTTEEVRQPADVDQLKAWLRGLCRQAFSYAGHMLVQNTFTLGLILLSEQNVCQLSKSSHLSWHEQG